MSVKVSNDFSTHTRKDSCRSNNCVSACLCCASANRHSVLSCRRSLIRPMIVPDSCAWQKPSRHFLPACAALQRRLASLNVRKSCACWLKTFWSAKIQLRFVTAFRFPQVHLETKSRALQKAEITFCVRSDITPPCGTPFFPVAFSIILSKCMTASSCTRRATFSNSRKCCTLSKETTTHYPPPRVSETRHHSSSTSRV